MDSFIEILQTILPAIITGIFTFLVTKYNYNKNIPLDKMEIAYNKIYCPIYKMINRRVFENININRFIYESSIILDKNYDYADKSTLKAFNLLQKHKDKETYLNFKNNITNKHLYLRRRLGYLEPNILQIYTYSSKFEKSAFRLLFEVVFLYVAVIFCSFSNGKIQSVLLWIGLISIIIIIFEFFIMLLIITGSKMKKIYKYISQKLKS